MANYDNDCLLVFRKVSELLNREIQSNGKLQKNNKEIWNALHAMDNDIWSMYLRGIKIIDKEFGHLVPMDTIATVLELERLLERYGHLSSSNNLLTPYKTRTNGHNYKGKAWKMVNQGREVWCSAMGTDLPNDDTSKLNHSHNIIEFG
jgi:hypothetical protein